MIEQGIENLLKFTRMIVATYVFGLLMTTMLGPTLLCLVIRFYVDRSEIWPALLILLSVPVTVAWGVVLIQWIYKTYPMPIDLWNRIVEGKRYNG